MRRMKNQVDGRELECFYFFMTVNMWEYYVLERPKTDEMLCLVQGCEQEIGLVSLKEVKPFMMGSDQPIDKLEEVMAPQGWEWI